MFDGQSKSYSTVWGSHKYIGHYIINWGGERDVKGDRASTVHCNWENAVSISGTKEGPSLWTLQTSKGQEGIQDQLYTRKFDNRDEMEP
jgi:hypothetical protein